MRLNGRRGARGFEELVAAPGMTEGKPATFEKLPTVEAVQLAEPITVDEGAGDVVAARPGDYVLELPDGSLAVMGPAEFEGNFRKRPAKKAPARGKAKAK